jgi:hypothetical protein
MIIRRGTTDGAMTTKMKKNKKILDLPALTSNRPIREGTKVPIFLLNRERLFVPEKRSPFSKQELP